MSGPAKASLHRLLRELDMRVSARLVALMVASALTEGVGLVLLVPMLSALAGSGSSNGVAHWLDRAGVPHSLGALLAIFAALVMARSAINAAQQLSAFRFQVRIVDRLRARAWDALVHCDWRNYSTMRQSEATSLLVANIERIGEAVSYVLTFMAMAITLASLGLAAAAISPIFVLVAALGGALVLIAYGGIRKRASLLGIATSRDSAQVFGVLEEGLRAMRVVKSLGIESDVSEEGAQAFAGLRQTQFAFIRDVGLGQAMLQSSGAVLLAGGVWVAMSHYGASAAEIVPLVALFARGLPLLGGVQEYWQNWLHCNAAITDTFALIDRAEAAREDDDGTGEAPALSRSLVFDAVTVRFAGSNRPALDHVSLTVTAGEMLAAIGPSGSGKSTLADLAGGLLSPDHGRVLVDGIALDSGIRRAWRRRVAYVQQDAVLFNGTLRANLARANPTADDARMAQAIADASADFVWSLPQGIDTVIGDGARRLSGGEQQRIALARALLRDPALLILDEAMSALDAANEAVVCQAIARLKGKLTMIIIGHRGALMELADRSIVLESGTIHPVPA